MKTKQSKTKTRTKAGQTASLRCDAIVRAIRAEIENLRRDSARLNWLEKHWRREIHLKDASTGICDEVELKLWHRRYVSSHDFNGSNVRNVLDQAMRLEP